MVICGQEFDFSVLNANDLERMEAAQKHMQRASETETRRPKKGYADALRGQCRLVMDYLDELLGDGASELLGLDGNDFGACTRVVEAFKQAIRAEQSAVQQAMAVPQNRAQRRAKAKHTQTIEYPRSKPREVVLDEEEAEDEEENGLPDTVRVAAARQAVQAMMDDPDALQQLADAALDIAAKRHA